MHVPLDPQARASLSSTEVVLPVPQSEIFVDVPKTPTPGGLLPALVGVVIDNVRASKATNAVTPLRNAMVDFNFDQTLADAFKVIAATDGVGVDSVRVVKDVSTSSLDQVVSGSKSATVLLAGTKYYLTNDGTSLWIEVYAGVFRAGQVPAGAPSAHPSVFTNALYRNTLRFTTTLRHPSSERDENIAAWAANNGANLRADLQRGAAKISQLIVADLLGGDAAAGKMNASDGSLEHQKDGTEIFRGLSE